MKLHCLGTTGYHPNEIRHTACYWLPEAGVVLDAGTGMFRLVHAPLGPTLDIFLTHAHLDHIAGLTFLLDVLHHRKMESVRVHGAPDKLDAIRRHLFAPEIFPVELPVQWTPFIGPVRLAGDGLLTTFPLEHPGGSLGFRLDWPERSMAYVTDVAGDPGTEYVERIRGVDLLLHEANFKDGTESFAKKTGHSCVSQAATVAKTADVKRLVLIHVDPRESVVDPIGLDAAQAIFPKTSIAQDGDVLEF